MATSSNSVDDAELRRQVIRDLVERGGVGDRSRPRSLREITDTRPSDKLNELVP